jgi:hypothetical protein
MFLASLVSCSMRLGVPFIAPTQLGAVGGQLGRPILPSVEWCTGGAPDSPVHHRTTTVAVRCTISFHSGHNRPLDLSARWRTGQSGASSRPLEWATCRTLIARMTVGRWHYWLTGQSGAPPDSPLNFSHVTFFISRERRVRHG